MKKYALMLVVVTVVSGGCTTPQGSGLVNYHYSQTLPVSAPVVQAARRQVWVRTPEGSVQAWQQGRETYVVDGAGQMIPVPSGVGLDIVYTDPRDIRVMRQEDRADFYALLRADEQNHRQSMNWARWRLQKQEQERRYELRERQEDRRDQEQAIRVLEDLNRLRNENIDRGTNIIPSPQQIRNRYQQSSAPSVVRTSPSRSVRATSTSAPKPYVAEQRQRVERPAVAPQKRQAVTRPAVERPSRPTAKPVASPRTRVITRPEAASQPRTRGGR